MGIWSSRTVVPLACHWSIRWVPYNTLPKALCFLVLMGILFQWHRKRQQYEDGLQFVKRLIEAGTHCTTSIEGPPFADLLGHTGWKEDQLSSLLNEVTRR